MLGRGPRWKSTTLLVFYLWLIKFLNNFLIICLFVTSRNVTFFLISSLVSGLLDQLQILSSVSDRNPRAWNRSRATWAAALEIISKFLDRVWYAGLLQKLIRCQPHFMQLIHTKIFFSLSLAFVLNHLPQKSLCRRTWKFI